MNHFSNKNIYTLLQVGKGIKNVFALLQVGLIIVFLYSNFVLIKDFYIHILSFFIYMLSAILLLWIDINLLVYWLIYSLKNNINTIELLDECRKNKLINEENRITGEGKFYSYEKYDYIETLIIESLKKNSENKIPSIEKLELKNNFFKENQIDIYYKKSYFIAFIIMFLFYLIIVVSILSTQKTISVQFLITLIIGVVMFIYYVRIIIKEIKYFKSPIMSLTRNGLILFELGSFEMPWKDIEIKFSMNKNNKESIVVLYNQVATSILWETKINFNMEEFKRIVNHYQNLG